MVSEVLDVPDDFYKPGLFNGHYLDLKDLTFAEADFFKDFTQQSGFKGPYNFAEQMTLAKF